MIRMQLDPKSLADMKRTLDRLGQGRQLDFALSKGINALANEARDATRKSLDKNFTIAPARRPFMERLVKIKYSSVSRSRKSGTPLEARLGTQVDDAKLTNAGGGASKERSALLGRHEAGGTVTASRLTPFYIPSKHLRPGAYDIPPRRLYPTALRLKGQRSVDGILPARARGKRRAFVMERKGGGTPIGIFERVSPTQVSPLWWFKTKITLKPRLGFYANAERIWRTRADAVFSEALDYALRTAK